MTTMTSPSSPAVVAASVAASVAAYVRVSTDDQDVAMQIDAISARGFAGATIYRDEGVSGAKAHRPGLDQLLAAVRAGRHKTVVVYRLDRLGRNVLAVLGLLHELNDLGVDFVSVTEGLDSSTPAGRMMIVLIAAFAAMERDVIRERVTSGLDRARRHGTKSGKPIGRPTRDIDLEAARLLLGAPGATIGRVARSLGIPESTLRRRFKDGGC